jgi:hypothetical protein
MPLDPVLQGADSLSTFLPSDESLDKPNADIPAGFMMHMNSHIGVTKFAMERHEHTKRESYICTIS